jgi:hypothetical protein
MEQGPDGFGGGLSAPQVHGADGRAGGNCAPGSCCNRNTFFPQLPGFSCFAGRYRGASDQAMGRDLGEAHFTLPTGEGLNLNGGAVAPPFFGTNASTNRRYNVFATRMVM